MFLKNNLIILEVTINTYVAASVASWQLIHTWLPPWHLACILTPCKYLFGRKYMISLFLILISTSLQFRSREFLSLCAISSLEISSPPSPPQFRCLRYVQHTQFVKTLWQQKYTNLRQLCCFFSFSLSCSPVSLARRLNRTVVNSKESVVPTLLCTL